MLFKLEGKTSLRGGTWEGQPISADFPTKEYEGAEMTGKLVVPP